jgi:uncharacterized protein YhbP (UPF0306 family)
MKDQADLASIARTIIDSNDYMVLATADEGGRPWASPVWYAPEEYREFFWVSSPEARHSRNLAVRPELGIVIFDSTVAVGAGQGVYMSAVADELSGEDLDRGIEIFSRRSDQRGAGAWTRDQVVPPAHLRLYRARVSEHSILDPAASRDERVVVAL